MGELKAELEYCRKKWAMSRALNSESEEQCKQLRHEFSMRKIQDQNSAESGYSDEHPSEDDEQEAGTSKKVTKVKKFDENLTKFDRTASPTYSERRRSESPLITDFSIFSVFSRAQSEPPRVLTDISDESEEPADMETFEVLDLIPDPILERCVAASRDEPLARENHMITPPPEIHVHDPPKLKAHLRKHKKDKKRKSDVKQAESAEEMFMRLTGRTKEECSTCSSTTSTGVDEEELRDENIEEIQDIPMDEAIEDCAEETCEEPPQVMTLEETVESLPSTSAEIDDISALTTKDQDYIRRKEARLARLEVEAQEFYDRMARNKDKGIQLNNHLNDVHQTFLDRNRTRTQSEDEKTKDEPTTSGETEKKADGPETEQNDDEK